MAFSKIEDMMGISMKRIIVVLMFALILVGCSSSASAASGKEVKIASFTFDPPSLTIPVGTTVKWTNQDQTDHTVTADDKSFDSGQLGQGQSFSFTFTKEGTFSYHCSNHTSMLGKIIVTK